MDVSFQESLYLDILDLKDYLPVSSELFHSSIAAVSLWTLRLFLVYLNKCTIISSSLFLEPSQSTSQALTVATCRSKHDYGWLPMFNFLGGISEVINYTLITLSFYITI